MINIFLIPSWYPNKFYPLAGSFIKEQSIWISESKKVDFTVSIAEELFLTPWSFTKTVHSLFNYFFNSKIVEKQINNNYKEIYIQVLRWSKKILNGNFNSLYKAHKNNLIKTLKMKKIDIIHAHVAYPAGYIAYLLSREFNIPYIITEHMGPFPFKDLLKGNKPIREIEVAINNACEVVAVSESLKNDICRFYLKEPIIIPNFINEEIYKFSYQKNKKNKFIFLTVGSLISQKGIDLLIKSISRAKLKDDNIEFRIVGDGKEEKVLKMLANQYKIKNIKFLGRLSREKVREEFKNCDCFVLPSRHESFGIVYIEALAFGKPIIATKCGGPEMIVNDKVGLLIEKENIDELSKALIFMKNNIEKYNPLIIRKYFLKNFSKQANISKYIKLYKKIIAQGEKCVE